MPSARPSVPVVSNTTPVSNLIRIGQLPLLGQVFGQVLIPAQVARELDDGRHVLGEWRAAPGAGCLSVEDPLDGPFLRQMQAQLDAGEAAAIALAVERRASLLLIDEVEGRETASYHRLRLSGTIGVLLRAKRAGLIGAVRPLLDALLSVNFRISAGLWAKALRAAGEA